MRALFTSKETTLMPFGVLPLHARMAQQAGFQAFEVSGGYSSFWLAGVADVGYQTMTEIVEQAARVARSVDIPVFCDADTGYGGPVNVQRTTRAFIDAGVAGIHLEDQAEPKKAGGRGGIRLVSDAEAIGRFAAAVEERDRRDPDFVLVARTDGYGAAGGGLDEAIRRGQLYREETGVDVIFYEGLETWEEIETALRETPGPAYAIPHRNAGPTPSVAEMTRMGQAIQIVPFLLPGVHEVWNLLRAVADSGELKPVDDYRAYVESFRGTDAWVGAGEALLGITYDEVAELEARLAPIAADATTGGGAA
ncbi:isocitrate lyase/PEP mutase family protein [Salinibacterium sp. ZJ454]|uniref:isocitrate lyase/PEP mutase family protein n=1 Tax=Salinibacterium sp. ZJ454 TaxID=2708339 RepID=UPI0014246757|nr:isocitrate lyase/PEP mutase family protein [Salinibacterium sp. ZJ454]